MILIDEDTERALSRSLEELRQGNGSHQCLHLRGGVATDSALRPTLIDAVKRHIPTEPQQLFLCSDGDVYIISPKIEDRDATGLVTEVAALLKIPATRDLFTLYEAEYHAAQLIAKLEHKIIAQREAAQKQQQQVAAELSAKRRQQILTQPLAGATPQAIASKRHDRTDPEIMVIEDDPFSRKLVDTAISKQFHVTGLGETINALQTYVAVAPDVLFLDINLPDVSGHDLLGRILNLDPQAYVVMLSGNCDRENVMQAMQMGAKGFVAKPFTREKLFQYIDKALLVRS